MGAQGLQVQGQVHCYWHRTDELSFQQAQAACQAQGGYLVTIQSSEENAFVRALAGTSDVWLGLARNNGPCTKANFSWLTAEPSTVDLWEAGYPECSGGSPHGARLRSDGEWRDSSQSSTRQFVCEVGPSFQ